MVIADGHKGRTLQLNILLGYFISIFLMLLTLPVNGSKTI